MKGLSRWLITAILSFMMILAVTPLTVIVNNDKLVIEEHITRSPCSLRAGVELQQYHKVYERYITVYKLYDCVSTGCTLFNAFYNWDFTSQLSYITNYKPNSYTTKLVSKEACNEYDCWECEKRIEIDWPINLVFYGSNLTYNKIADLVGDDPYLIGDRDWPANPMYMYLKPWWGGWTWVEHTGEKKK